MKTVQRWSQQLHIIVDTGDHGGLWWRFAQTLFYHPAPVITLSPVYSAPLNQAACHRLSISPLRDENLPRHSLKGFEQSTLSAEKVREILILLSPLPIIDTGLLRQLRDYFKWGASHAMQNVSCFPTR